MKLFLAVLKWFGIVSGALILALALLVAYWALRPNHSQVAAGLPLDTWVAVDDGTHNSNTDLVDWREAYYMVYASSPYHFASAQSHLVVKRSTDGHTWTELARFDAGGEDIRDPKFAVIGGRLFLYALKNVDFTAEPYETVYSMSDDGSHWTPFKEIEPKGWLFWRPKSFDGQIWYVPAYWHEHGKSVLLGSMDGMTWSIVGQIYAGDRNDETDIAFLPDGHLLATARLEFSDSYFGDPQGSTLIATSQQPYDQWMALVKSPVTRLDGPNLFTYNGQVYAVGRYQPVVGGPFTWQGSILARKRTALFLVQESGLVYLSDLPSSGDTSYAGLVVRGDDLLICYYTSDVRHDPVWVLGMVGPSSIRMARLNLPSLAALAADRVEGKTANGE